jgi:branched-chain amino acid aminotransferase
MGTILLDDDVRDEMQAGVSFMSPGFAYAACVFEGICVYAGTNGNLSLFRLDDHLLRLNASMRAMGFEGAPGQEIMRERVIRAVRVSGLEGDGHVRLMAYVDGATTIGTRGPVRTAIIVRSAHDRPSARPGFHCHVSSWRKPSDAAMPARIKCTANYVTGRMATLEAQRAGAEAAILLSDEGAVAEGPTANLFVMRRGELCTPRLCDGILEGITRDTIIALWNESGRPPVRERRIDRSELADCSFIFFCGSLWEISPVLSVDGAQLDPEHRDVVWLKRRYAEAVRGDDGGRGWSMALD